VNEITEWFPKKEKGGIYGCYQVVTDYKCPACGEIKTNLNSAYPNICPDCQEKLVNYLKNCGYKVTKE